LPRSGQTIPHFAFQISHCREAAKPFRIPPKNPRCDNKAASRKTALTKDAKKPGRGTRPPPTATAAISNSKFQIPNFSMVA
jgi:hypothetical protein